MSATLVTGAASGIGRRLVGRLLQAGHRVAACDVNESALQQAAVQDQWPADRTEVIRLDVTDAEAWERAVSRACGRFGDLEVLANVAGVLHPAYVTRIQPDELRRQLDVNARGAMLGTIAAAKIMSEQRRGQIINLASLAALAPVPGLSIYSASKYAVRGFSLAAAYELRPRGVSVTIICPDGVKTPMLDHEVGFEETALVFSGPRLLSTDEVCDAILHDAMVNRPLEIYLPASRGWLARMADLMPGLFFRLEPAFRKRGEKARRALLP